MADTDAELPTPPDDALRSQVEQDVCRLWRREALRVQLANLQTRLTLLNDDLRGITSTLRRLGDPRSWRMPSAE
jgi:hypothetical protein